MSWLCVVLLQPPVWLRHMRRVSTGTRKHPRACSFPYLHIHMSMVIRIYTYMHWQFEAFVSVHHIFVCVFNIYIYIMHICISSTHLPIHLMHIQLGCNIFDLQCLLFFRARKAVDNLPHVFLVISYTRVMHYVCVFGHIFTYLPIALSLYIYITWGPYYWLSMSCVFRMRVALQNLKHFSLGVSCTCIMHMTI